MGGRGEVGSPRGLDCGLATGRRPQSGARQHAPHRQRTPQPPAIAVLHSLSLSLQFTDQYRVRLAVHRSNASLVHGLIFTTTHHSPLTSYHYSSAGPLSVPRPRCIVHLPAGARCPPHRPDRAARLGMRAVRRPVRALPLTSSIRPTASDCIPCNTRMKDRHARAAPPPPPSRRPRTLQPPNSSACSRRLLPRFLSAIPSSPPRKLPGIGDLFFSDVPALCQVPSTAGLSSGAKVPAARPQSVPVPYRHLSPIRSPA